MKFKYFIDDIISDILPSKKYSNLEDIKEKCNLIIVDLSKFIYNKNID